MPEDRYPIVERGPDSGGPPHSIVHQCNICNALYDLNSDKTGPGRIRNRPGRQVQGYRDSAGRLHSVSHGSYCKDCEAEGERRYRAEIEKRRMEKRGQSARELLPRQAPANPHMPTRASHAKRRGEDIDATMHDLRKGPAGPNEQS